MKNSIEVNNRLWGFFFIKDINDTKDNKRNIFFKNKNDMFMYVIQKHYCTFIKPEIFHRYVSAQSAKIMYI